ncbi:MAG TPA: hypothetical protein VGF79_06970 [Bacteroidia bacterium]
MKIHSIYFILSITIFIFSCKKVETDSPKQLSGNQKIDLRGLWKIESGNEYKYIEFSEKTYTVFLEDENAFKTIKTDSFIQNDSNQIQLKFIGQSSLLIKKNNDGSIEIGDFKMISSIDKPKENWFKSTQILAEKTDLLVDNELGIGTFNAQLLACKPGSDDYYIINPSNFQMTEIWMKGTVPTSIDSDGDLVFASMSNSFSLLIHLSSGGMAYEEINGMGEITGIAVQPGTPYVWLYSKNDTLYKYHKNLLKIISRSHVGDNLSDACWYNDQILFCKGSSLFQYNVTDRRIVNTFLVDHVGTIHGVANVNGDIWINADGNRLMKIKLLQ